MANESIGKVTKKAAAIAESIFTSFHHDNEANKTKIPRSKVPIAVRKDICLMNLAGVSNHLVVKVLENIHGTAISTGANAMNLFEKELMRNFPTEPSPDFTMYAENLEYGPIEVRKQAAMLVSELKSAPEMTCGALKEQDADWQRVWSPLLEQLRSMKFPGRKTLAHLWQAELDQGRHLMEAGKCGPELDKALNEWKSGIEWDRIQNASERLLRILEENQTSQDREVLKFLSGRSEGGEDAEKLHNDCSAAFAKFTETPDFGPTIVRMLSERLENPQSLAQSDFGKTLFPHFADWRSRWTFEVERLEKSGKKSIAKLWDQELKDTSEETYAGRSGLTVLTRIWAVLKLCGEVDSTAD